MSENTRRPKPPAGEERGALTEAFVAGLGGGAAKATVDYAVDKLRNPQNPPEKK